MKKFLKGIDFDMLRKQKLSLLKLQDKCIKEKEHEYSQTLSGVINLIDEIQDIAVDKYGYDG